MEEGYKFFADNKMVTLFSAPNYNGYGYPGAFMSVNNEMTGKSICKIRFIPVDRHVPRIQKRIRMRKNVTRLEKRLKTKKRKSWRPRRIKFSY